MIPKILPRYWLISFVLYIGTNFGLMICGGRLRDVFQKGYNKFNDKFNTAYMALSALYFMVSQFFRRSFPRVMERS